VERPDSNSEETLTSCVVFFWWKKYYVYLFRMCQMVASSMPRLEWAAQVHRVFSDLQRRVWLCRFVGRTTLCT